MKIVLKTIKKEEFSLEVEPTDAILSIKQKLHKDHGHEPSWQTLIFSGHILDDAKLLKDYNVRDGDFLVLMVRKPKQPEKPVTSTTVSQTPSVATAPTTAPAPAPATTTTTTTTTATTAASTPPTTAPPSSQTTTTTSPTSTPATAPAPASTGAIYADAASNLVTGTAFQGMVQQLVDLGFDKSQVVVALRAAYNNPDRAYDYLTNGIPDSVLASVAQAESAAAAPTSLSASPAQPTTAPLSATPTSPATTPASAPSPAPVPAPAPAAVPPVGGNLFTMAPTTQASPGSGTFDFLRNHPQFNQLRQLVQQNPSLLHPVLQHLGMVNPNILQLINQNQDEFLGLLNEPVPPGTPSIVPPGAQTVSYELSQEESDAVERLVKMGYDRETVVEAFIVCERDEMLTANYLVDHGHVMEEDELADEGVDDDSN